MLRFNLPKYLTRSKKILGKIKLGENHLIDKHSQIYIAHFQYYIYSKKKKRIKNN